MISIPSRSVELVELERFLVATGPTEENRTLHLERRGLAPTATAYGQKGDHSKSARKRFSIWPSIFSSYRKKTTRPTLTCIAPAGPLGVGPLFRLGKVQIREIHVGLRFDPQGQHAFALRQCDRCQNFRIIPMVPLPPRKRIGGVVGGFDSD